MPLVGPREQGPESGGSPGPIEGFASWPRQRAAHGQLANQLKDLERREQQLGLLREIDAKMLAGVPPPDLLQAAVEVFARLAGTSICVLVTADPETGVLRPLAAAAADLEAVCQYFTTFQPRDGDGRVGWPLRRERPL